MKVLVTGGGGFLGSVVCRQLTERGHTVRALHRNHYPHLDEWRVEQHLGDVRSGDATDRAVDGCDAVIHCAAKAGFWGPPAEYHDINVGGTENVLSACARHGIRWLVHTSSFCVVQDGGDLEGVDESVPYTQRFLAAYQHSKTVAEQRVLAANSPRLATIALRPHVIWGPGDPHFAPRILALARRGRLRVLGRSPKKIDSVYVDNAAEAHVLALDRLQVDRKLVAGKSYFITQGEPFPTDVTLNALLVAAGLEPEKRRLPVGLARVLGAALEFTYRLARVRSEPLLTRFLVNELSTAHWFDISAARRDLGYEPRVSAVEGLLRLSHHLAHERLTRFASLIGLAVEHELASLRQALVVPESAGEASCSR
ncbi:NAD-dependent epimerase/dehydratase family protein [Streptoalloteichus hindustanus]|uniref:Nucleoside-diphosphate-sugar epimerase n=1 Tax=Streptoalloteichus hindustanus TaxID=2017 RepID=A0A1M4YQS1_STRHI|nr:NAD-dependent epimerase/dehydratase family protein [Streptoalloteichus hindustanus]SHF08110.1 Nucleoside-diphosphate-sugar epimerase [Streptoalloteichus hindustanus]